MKNTSMNHYNGRVVREQWPVEALVSFKPKGWCGGEPLKGIVTGHVFVNVLIIKSENTEWAVSTFRCTRLNALDQSEPIEESTICNHDLYFFSEVIDEVDPHVLDKCLKCKLTFRRT